jgi:uncharacterized iron-regulated membrane protein
MSGARFGDSFAGIDRDLVVKIFFRKLHRWLGLAMALQIIAWMASGLYFSIFPIEEIRGEHLTREAGHVDAAMFAALGSTQAVTRALDRHFPAGWTLDTIRLVSDGEQGLWRVRGESEDLSFTRLVNSAGEVLPRIDESKVADVALGWLLEDARVAAVEWVETAAPGSEFRNGRLPVWRVTFAEPESLRLYLDPWSGEILSRRTTRWRIFDFFWMLHVMDFSERNDFNHPLLQIAAALGVIVALGGVILWAVTTRLFRKRKIAVA